ncbi:MAG: TetR family transcriptional regulator [Cryobacterium sp.]|nr:TetR family transcriptional regulator [Cryobacterium sp.]
MSTPPGRTTKGAAKREAILAAALEVFGEVGLHGASLREIASRVGVSHQSLMHYFPTKNALLMAVLRRRDERLRSHFDDEGGMSLTELVSLAEDNVHSPGVIELYNMASAEATNSDHPAHAYYAEFYESIIASHARYLQRAVERGALREGWTPETAARAILGMMDGLQLQWLYDRDDVHVAETMKLLISAIISVPLDELDNAEK